MQAFGVIENDDAVGKLVLISSGCAAVAAGAFHLQIQEKAFHDSLVLTIALAVHAEHASVADEQLHLRQVHTYPVLVRVKF